VLLDISRQIKKPLFYVSYGGRKDKHAKTTQHITIKNFDGLPERIDGKNYFAERIGFLDRPMGPDLIDGNKFEITIRDLSQKEIQGATIQLEEIKKDGFVNYFDDQRFGSFDPKGGFLAERILKEHYNGAVKIYLTRPSSEDRKDDKERKQFFWDNWGKWEQCLASAKTLTEKKILVGLKRNPGDFLSAIRHIPSRELSLFYSAYQGALWNEVVRRLLRLYVTDRLTRHKGSVAPYLFYTFLEADKLRRLRNILIPLAASNMKVTDSEVQRIYQEVLHKEEIKPAMFNIRKIRHAFFKSTERSVIVFLRHLMMQAASDEMNEGRKKMTLRFVLARGSYATMLIKRIFSS